jgi:hypothetical protein
MTCAFYSLVDSAKNESAASTRQQEAEGSTERHMRAKGLRKAAEQHRGRRKQCTSSDSFAADEP